MRKDQEPASINADLRQKGQIAEAEAARDVLTEQYNALNAPIQKDISGVYVAFRAVEHIAFAALAAVVRVQLLPATCDQLVVTHSGEPRNLLAVGASEWLARVAASRWRLADQPDLVRLDLLLFHDVDSSRRRIWIASARADGKRFVVRAPERLTASLELESGKGGRVPTGVSIS